MKRAALCILCALLLISGFAQAGNQKNLPVTLDFFESLTYATTLDDFKEKIGAMGGRVQRDGLVFDFALNGIPIKRIDPSFQLRGAELICIIVEFEPRRSSTYMEPGPNYDAVLEMLYERYGMDYEEIRTVTRHSKAWTTGQVNVWLHYDTKLRERAARIWLDFIYEHPRFPSAEYTSQTLPATPATFVFPNGAKMGMNRDQVKALHTGKPRTDRGKTLAYQTKLFDLDMDTRITYAFDQQGKLAFIAA
ncbi:MAG: hypothetical protein FWD25_10385 [Clostridia bacterium]|nr:hypothetical protein [Clostridia bacterium]